MNIKKVTIGGSGVLGSQIAFQTAYKGFNVSVYDINDSSLEKALERFSELAIHYKKDLNATQKEIEETFSRLNLSSDLKEAVADADLVIEAVPEVISVKKSFYENLSAAAPAKTIFTSNSSTMVPSQLVGFTDRPEKFLHLHFANQIWINNTAEIMKHEGTDENIFNEIIDFAKEIGMIALPIYKEQPGYILNSLLVPFLDAAQYLIVNGIASPETIDKTWMAGLGVSKGPFAILDIIGLNTPYNIASQKAESGHEISKKIADYFKNELIDKNRMGIQNGKGFYDYPNPAYQNPDFLS